MSFLCTCMFSSPSTICWELAFCIVFSWCPWGNSTLFRWSFSGLSILCPWSVCLSLGRDCIVLITVDLQYDLESGSTKPLISSSLGFSGYSGCIAVMYEFWKFFSISMKSTIGLWQGLHLTHGWLWVVWTLQQYSSFPCMTLGFLL